LDLFAGSGAVGIEAWSRGASFVCLVESSRRVLPVLRENVGLVEGGAAEVRGSDAFRFLRGETGAARFDVIFADPPYAAVRGAGGPAFTARLLAGIAEGGRLAADGLVVLEGAAGAEVPAEPGWRLTDERRYGSVGVTFFVRA
jgi:16S rRNA (guanine966-N2)-methyltransferase